MLYLRVYKGRVENARLEAQGCGVTIAYASMLTELVIGRSIAACRQIIVHELSEVLDGVPTGKQYCADVTIAALQDAIRGSP